MLTPETIREREAILSGENPDREEGVLGRERERPVWPCLRGLDGLEKVGVGSRDSRDISKGK